MEDKSTWTLLFAALGITGLAAWFTEEKPAPGPNAAPTPDTTIGTGSTLQQRPMPTFSTMSSDGQASYVKTMQRELSAIGYGDLPVNGDPTDAATMAAFNRFANGVAGAESLRAYGYGFGGGSDVDMAAQINAIDDIARDNLSAGHASDYRAPVAATAGLSGALAPDGNVAVAVSNAPRHVLIRRTNAGPSRRVLVAPSGIGGGCGS